MVFNFFFNLFFTSFVMSKLMQYDQATLCPMTHRKNRRLQYIHDTYPVGKALLITRIFFKCFYNFLSMCNRRQLCSLDISLSNNNFNFMSFIKQNIK